MTRSIPIDRYRTIGILASQDAGRTTTTERILAVAEPAARDERAITMTTAATSCLWNGCRLHIVELPGISRPVDAASLASVDAVVVVVDAERGITAEVGAVLAQAQSLGLARLVFVNKLDRANVDLARIVEAIPGGALLQLPIGAGTGLAGLVDLVSLGGVFWRDARADAVPECGEVPAELAEAAEAARRHLAALLGVAVETAALAGAIRAAARAGSMVPVLCGSAFFNRGTRRLLDAVVDYLPSPADVALTVTAADGNIVARHASDEEPFAGLAFRTVADPAAGTLTFVRIYSGVLATGARVVNAGPMSGEHIGAMMRIHANRAEAVDEARTGDIVALVGLQHTISGDTLCDPAAPVILGAYRPRTAA
jgi:elongation factor G